jgi:DNA repair protein RadC
VHNHPSLNAEPSSEDIEVTDRMKEAGELLDIRLLDHVIIGEGFYSFRERGVLN